MTHAWLPTLVGLALIVVTMRDVVHELFHPEGGGALSRAVTAAVWRLVRAVGRRRRAVLLQAGPLILIAVALAWTTLLLVGWALLFWPRLGGGFHADPSLAAGEARGFGTAVYVSMASMTTLSASDLTPATAGMRWAVTLESYVGLVLFTAWITWVLGIYPVLADRRALTHEVSILRRAHDGAGSLAREAPPEVAAAVLRSLAEQVLRAVAHLRQTRVSYYFQNESANLALATQLPWLLALARAAEHDAASPAVRHHGRMLGLAVGDLLALIDAQFLGRRGGSNEQIIHRLAVDHLLDAEHDPWS